MKNNVISYPQRASRKRGLLRIIIFMVLTVCIGGFIYLFWGQTCFYRQIKKEADAIEGCLEEARAENEGLKEEIRLLQDQEYIEIQARKHLGMVRPGEIIFFIGD
ncbi:MAG: septum formation initiator family protein [Firmicutes bacterium]|nr:septum formation initiator family protein [Bacillota bacterium]